MALRILITVVALFFAVGAAADDFQILPTVAVRQEYNDNIFFDEDDQEADFITTVIPGLEFNNRTERAQFRLGGQVRPFFYWDNSDLDDIDHDYFTRLKYKVTPKLDVNADAGFRIDNRPDRDIAATGLVFDTERRDRYHAGGGLGYRLSEILSVNIAYGYDRDDFKGDADEDFKGHTVSAGYSRNLSRYLRATTGRLNLGYGRYDYETSDSQSVFGSLGVQTALNETFSFLVDAGARYVDSDFETLGLVDDSSSNLGAIGSAALRYDGLKTNWSLKVSQDLRTASGTRGPSYLTRLGLALDHRVLERLSVGVSGGYNRNRADAEDFASQEIDEDSFYVRPRLRWEFWRNFTLEGAYSYRYVTDDVDDTNAEQHQVYLQLAYGFPLFDMLEDLGGLGSGPVSGGYPWQSPN